MTYFKKTFVWIIALVAILGYNWLEVENTRLDDKAKEEATRLFPFTPIEVLAATLRKEGQELELERWEEGWRIVKPIEATADNEAVEKFLGYVLDSRNDADYVMDPDPTPERLAEFGLKSPTNSVTLKVGRELTKHTLIFGDRAPTMGVAFARVEGKRAVYRVLSASRAEADKDIYYFRNKKVLKNVNPVEVDQVAVRRGKNSILLRLPDNGKWTLEKPIVAALDHTRVFEMLAAFNNAEIKEFVAESQEELEQYGLNLPQAELNFWMTGDPEPSVKLAVGRRDPKKRGYYCSVTGHNGVIVLAEEIINALPRSGNDLRNREIFVMERELLHRIEIRSTNGVLALVKDNDKEWRRNNISGDQIDFQQVKEFLDELTALRIDDFLPDAFDSFSGLGLDPPLMQVTLWQEGSATPMALSLGYQEPSGGRLYAHTGDREALLVDSRIKRVLTTYF